jgi:hypothetical protein
MDKIEIIEYDEEDDSEEDINDDELEEQEKYEEHKNSIKQKTDRELMEGISSRLVSLEIEMKHVREDLVDIYNLLLESVNEEEE